MKYMLLAIFVLFAAQPVQGSVCDMCDDQRSTHSQHGNMHDGDMAGMDCCDHEPAGTEDGCGSSMHCGSCSAGVVAITLSSENISFGQSTQPALEARSAPLSRFHSPPFRPPIS